MSTYTESRQNFHPGQQAHHGQQQPPQVPHGWTCQWDNNFQTWFYINLQTGQSQWEPPHGDSGHSQWSYDSHQQQQPAGGHPSGFGLDHHNHQQHHAPAGAPQKYYSEDEELARRLQAEEYENHNNSHGHGHSTQPPASQHLQPPMPMQGHPGGSPQHQQHHGSASPHSQYSYHHSGPPSAASSRPTSSSGPYGYTTNAPHNYGAPHAYAGPTSTTADHTASGELTSKLASAGKKMYKDHKEKKKQKKSNKMSGLSSGMKIFGSGGEGDGGSSGWGDFFGGSGGDGGGGGGGDGGGGGGGC